MKAKAPATDLRALLQRTTGSLRQKTGGSLIVTALHLLVQRRFGIIGQEDASVLLRLLLQDLPSNLIAGGVSQVSVRSTTADEIERSQGEEGTRAIQTIGCERNGTRVPASECPKNGLSDPLYEANLAPPPKTDTQRFPCYTAT
jgi:hypothetical protein